MELTGGCLCKAVRYRIAEAPVTARACWCRMCQTIGGGSGTVNALFNTTALTVTGELREFTFIADSGNVCPICGTHVLVTSERRPHFTAVRVGTLDDPNKVTPASTIWTSMAPTWAAMDPRLPRLDGQPPPGRSTLSDTCGKSSWRDGAISAYTSPIEEQGGRRCGWSAAAGRACASMALPS